MRLRLFLLLILVPVFFAGEAQIIETQIVLEQLQTESNSGVISIQKNAENKAKIDLLQIKENENNKNLMTFDAGAFYKNVMVQYGNENKANLQQSGEKHKSVVFQKNNANELGNEANLWSEGSETQNVAVQVGANNRINQFLENYYASLRSAVSYQLGDDNKLDLKVLDNDENSKLVDVTVTQTGNANEFDLSLESADVPFIKVKQEGGAKAVVTHSDFYFPMK